MGRRWALLILFWCWPVVLVSLDGPPMTDAVLLGAIRLVDAHTWTLTDGQDPDVAFQTLSNDLSVHRQEIYSGVGPGGSVIAAPFYAGLRTVLARLPDHLVRHRRFLTYYVQRARDLGVPVPGHFKAMYLLQLVLVGAVMAPLFAALLVRLDDRLVRAGLERSHAVTIVVALGLGSMLLYYSAAYSRQGLACLLAWHACLSLEARTKSAVHSVLGGLLAGLAVTVEYQDAMLVAVMLAMVLATADVKRGVQVVTPLLVVLGLLAIHHTACFGSPFATPYSYRYWHVIPELRDRGLDLTNGLTWPSPTVMAQLCFGPFKGLFVYSPILLLGFSGLVKGSRQAGPQRRFVLGCLGVFGIYLAFNSMLGARLPNGWFYWSGLTVVWGPRYLVPVLPFLAIGLAWLEWERAGVRRACWSALAASVAFNMAGTAASDVIAETYAFGPDAGFPVVHVLHVIAAHGLRAPILQAYGVSPIVQTLTVGTLIAVSCGVLFVAGRRPRRALETRAAVCHVTAIVPRYDPLPS